MRLIFVWNQEYLELTNVLAILINIKCLRIRLDKITINGYNSIKQLNSIPY